SDISHTLKEQPKAEEDRPCSHLLNVILILNLHQRTLRSLTSSHRYHSGDQAGDAQGVHMASGLVQVLVELPEVNAHQPHTQHIYTDPQHVEDIVPHWSVDNGADVQAVEGRVSVLVQGTREEGRTQIDCE